MMEQAHSSMVNREVVVRKEPYWVVQDAKPSFILKLGALRASSWPDNHPASHPFHPEHIGTAFLDNLRSWHVGVEVLVLVNRLSPFSTAVEFEDGVGVLEALEGSAQLTFRNDHTYIPVVIGCLKADCP